MPVKDLLNKVNDGPFGSKVTNFAAVRGSGGVSDCAGERDFTNPQAQKIDSSTMFAEGSIGKVRFAGLAYILNQEKKIRRC